ncbi:MAG: peptide-methionine (S)-S-oxide reductase MsrA [Pyrinomonadaceae bacterium MAG19_C2-C3]|nr:peptide-methionine (S)-S-oxide reductase MsrA [Pyrinomonadaceae bacterium MAG19_C2-C3]
MIQQATFGAGCFWGVEVAFGQTEGVTETAVGYMGGETANPTYREVCTDTTGHAEVVHIVFDTERLSYQELLNVFFENHDPTQLNRQGPDTGTQYRSAIFYYTPEQEQIARRAIEKLESEGRFKRPVVTQIAAAATFYRAEDYHQKYLEKRGLASCHVS